MHATRHHAPALALAALLLNAPAWADGPAAVPAAAPAPSASAPAVDSPAATGKRVIEDERVRIEEARVRGQTQSVRVHTKLPGVRDYEVIMPPLGKDPSQDKGAAGKRTWSLFDF